MTTPIRFTEHARYGDVDCRRVIPTDDLPATGPLPPGGQVCGRPATSHLWLIAALPTCGVACQEHTDEALAAGWVDDHHELGAVCNMPGTTWVYGDPSTCVLDLPEDILTTTAQLEDVTR